MRVAVAHKKLDSLIALFNAMSQNARRYAAQFAFEYCLEFDYKDGLVEVLAVAKPDRLHTPAISLAILLGADQCVDVLLRNGYDPNKLDWQQRPAIIYAALNGRIDLIQRLAKHGVSVNSIDGEGNSPLHLAAPKFELLKELLKLGADVNAVNTLGRTPLFAVKDVECAKILVEHKANINRVDLTNYTADEWLIKSGYSEAGLYLQMMRREGTRYGFQGIVQDRLAINLD